MSVRSVVVTAGVLVLLLHPDELIAQQSLTTARQLYGSAEYKDALSMLDSLLKTNPTPQDRQTIDLYRTFCLVALGSMNEATAGVDAMITRDPLYHPNLDEVPPRLRTLFRDARVRLLPGIIQQRYLAAKAAFDRNDLRVATEGFTQLLIALADPDIASAARQAPLADIKTLATGFNELAIRTLAPPPIPQVASTPSASGPPTVSPSRPPVALPVAAPPAAALQSKGVSGSGIYTSATPGIVEPAVIRQTLPQYEGLLRFPKRGVVEVVIDETGGVQSASMIESVDPGYNRTVLSAAKAWTYRPARLNGTPVKFRKRIEINVSPGN
jgi:TonB family protein